MSQKISKTIVLAVLVVLTADRPASADSLLSVAGDIALSKGGSAVNIQSSSNSALQFQGEGATMSFVVDSNDDANNALTHQYVWYVNNFQQASRGMQFTIAQGSDDGTLRVAGPVVPSGFDLAENFWMSESVRAGEIVSVDPRRGDAVQKSGGAYDRRTVGVATARPAIAMGGTALSLEHLNRNWGTAVVELFERERPEFEAIVLSTAPALAQKRLQLSVDHASEVASGARMQLEAEIFDGVMRLFFERHMISVALAGRVPVLADTSGGPIEPGDPVTASPTRGVAMRAQRAGAIIGYALEGLPAGRDQILVLVQRGWFPGESPTRQALAERDREIAHLRDRLDELTHLLSVERQLAEVNGDVSIH